MPEERTSVRISDLELALGGKYKILGKIGAGGFGEVYLGEHNQLHRKVAIKILLHSISTQPELVKRFQREARSAAALSHPNIIDIYDVGESEGIYFFVMKYIDGETLSERMRRDQTIPPAETIHIIQQVADALDYAHENNVVHRDIKPANVMLDAYGKPLLMDFGVARVQYEGNLTKTGTLLGTPHYLAPEQPLGKPVDGRSDIYSLGVLLYEMLAGRPPFHDENSITLIFKHINEPPAPLNSLAPDLDPELCLVVHKMIEKNPDNRYQTAGEVVEALHRLTTIYPVQPGAARRSTPGTAHNTERLLLLAQEHIEKDKMDKAIQIFDTITRRTPIHETAKKQIKELLPKLVEKVRQHTARKEFTLATELLSQIAKFSPDDPGIAEAREELTREKEAHHEHLQFEFKAQLDAAQEALKSNNTSEAMEHLTKAATINTDDEDVQKLIKETEKRITSEVDLLCENLDFKAASQMLNVSKNNFPSLVRKTGSVERYRTLYEMMDRARKLFEQQKWNEAVKSYEQFLQSQPPYDYKVFNTLRTEAQDSLTKAQKRLAEITPPPMPSVAATPVTIAEPVKAGASESGAKLNKLRLAILVMAGFILIGIVWAGANFLTKQVSQPDTSQPDLSFIRKLSKKPAVTQPEGPAVGVLSITSDPDGATVFLGKEEKGKTPLQIADLTLGKYSIQLKMKGYQDSTQEVELKEPNQNLNVPVTLQPAEPMVGTLVIGSIPPGASIQLSSRVVGNTPQKLDNTNAGKYTIILRKDGFQDYQEGVRVKKGETTTLTASLVAVPKPVPQPEKPKEAEVKPGMLVALTADVIPPKAIKKAVVKFPEAAKNQKLGGTVKLSLLVSETGKIIDVKVVSSAHPILDQAAVNTVKEWVYAPALKKGVPVKVWLNTSITFAKPK